jgi:hypothetical protein
MKARPREVQQLPPMEERESGDGAEMEQSFAEGDEAMTRECRTPSFNTMCASLIPAQHQQGAEHEAILHDLYTPSDTSLLCQGAIVRCRVDGSEAHGHIVSISPWDAVVDFGGARSIIARSDVVSVMAPSGEMVDLRSHAPRLSSPIGEDLAFQLPEVGSMGGLPSVPFSFGDFQPSPLAPNWLGALAFDQMPTDHAGRFGMGVMGIKAEPMQGQEAHPAFFQDFHFAPMDTADPILPSMFVGAHEGLESALGHLDVFFPPTDGFA